MRKIFRYALCIVHCALMMATTANAAVGTWRNYLSYYEPQQAEDAGSYLFVLASNALYQYNRNDQSITTYDKTNGMNDVYITQIAWCNAAKRLVAVYENGNIDLVSTNGDIVNLPDLYMKSMTEDKTVNSIYTYGKYAYLSTNFGIVKVNVADAEIQETYNLGFKVNYSYIDGSTIYAASQSAGTYSASLSSNLIDKSNWTYASGYVAKTKTIDSETLALIETLQPGGPKYNYFNYMYFQHGRLYTSGGGWTTGTEYFRPGCVQVLENDNWRIYGEGFNLLHNVKYQDNTSMAIDPNDKDHVFVSNVHCGLIEFQNGEYVNNYTEGNSELHSVPFNSDGTPTYNYVRVDGLTYDNQGNLLMLNSTSASHIVEYTTNNEWKSYNFDCLLMEGYKDRSLGILRRSTLSQDNKVWFVNDHYIHPSLFCYVPSSETILDFNTFVNQDGVSLDINNVKYVTFDKDGYVWIGTNAGPFYLNNSQSQDPTLGYTQPKVPRNDGTNLADYLLSNVEITCIAVDAANRKWFGTSGNGVYVINADNTSQIYNFTASNSCLLSDAIEDIAINNTTGEVFIGTAKGLCSYMGDATETNEDMTTDNVYAYPNPVTPAYTGMVTIVGLSFNADVKIVSSNGALVNGGKSNGGTFQWNCCDAKGKRVTSGMYFVVTAKENGSKGTVCKIAIVN